MDTVISNLTIGHLILLLVTLAIIAFDFIYIAIKWSDLPEEIPSHYNLSGECDGYGGKGTVFVLPIVSIFLTFMFSLVCLLPKKYWRFNLGLDSIEYSDEMKAKIVHFTCYYLISLVTFINIFFTYLLICMINGKNILGFLTIAFIVILIASTILFTVKIYRITYSSN